MGVGAARRGGTREYESVMSTVVLAVVGMLMQGASAEASVSSYRVDVTKWAGTRRLIYLLLIP